jgi:transposase InsO family protein
MPLGDNEDMTKLTRGKIQQIIKKKGLGCCNGDIAAEMDVSKRRVQQVWSAYRKSGEAPQLCEQRRPKRILTETEKAAIEKSYKEVFLGARMLRYHIRRHRGLSIPHNKIHEYLLERGYASESRRKKKQRKRCRYERRHSLSLVHTDWLVYNRRKAIGYTDDASRKLLALGEFRNATWLNSVGVLKIAEEHAERFNGHISDLNSDRGSQFCVNTTPGYKVESRFQKYLKTRGIRHIPSRVKNPQTNGKMERWVQEYKRHRDKFKSSEEFMAWYNNRLHGALDLENAETPNEAFLRKLRPEALLGMFLRNFEGGLYVLKDM